MIFFVSKRCALLFVLHPKNHIQLDRCIYNRVMMVGLYAVNIYLHHLVA